MHGSHRSVLEQQKRVRRRAEESDSYAFFNLLTGPQLLDGVEEWLPPHRERLFPSTRFIVSDPIPRQALFRTRQNKIWFLTQMYAWFSVAAGLRGNGRDFGCSLQPFGIRRPYG